MGGRRTDGPGPHRGSAGIARVSRQLQEINTGQLTGRRDVLRSVADFGPKVKHLTPLLDTGEQRQRLFRSVVGLDPERRRILGTAIGASAIAKELRSGLNRDRFVRHSTLSLGTLASAQLSSPAIRQLSQPGFNVSAGVLADRSRIGAYGKLAEQFHEALVARRPFLKGGVATPMQGFSESIHKLVGRFAAGAWQAVQLREEIDEEAILFVERHGWPLPLALPVRVVHHVVRMRGRGKREVQQLMCESFRPRTKAYRASRDRLLDSDHFRARRQPIEQGLSALNRGHYYAAVCTLLPLVEGVLVDVVLDHDPPRVGAAQQAFAAMREVGDEVDAVIVQSVETLVVSATSGAALFGPFDRTDYGGSGESRRLNRHAILHGSARRYGTHANALKMFLLLTAMAEVLDIYEEERGQVLSTQAAA